MQGLVHRFQERLSWGFALACLFSIGTGIIALAPKSIVKMLFPNDGLTFGVFALVLLLTSTGLSYFNKDVLGGIIILAQRVETKQ